MKTQTFTSVWDAICDTPAEAENLKLRAELMRSLSAMIADSKMNQTEAADLMGITQPRVSDLMRGKIDLFSLDALVNMAAAAGRHVEMRLAKAA